MRFWHQNKDGQKPKRRSKQNGRGQTQPRGSSRKTGCYGRRNTPASEVMVMSILLSFRSKHKLYSREHEEKKRQVEAMRREIERLDEEERIFAAQERLDQRRG